MLIDTHCHLNFNAFKDDADEVILRTLKEGIKMIIVGTQYDTSLRAIDYVKKYDGVYAAIGLHPVHLKNQKIKEKVGKEEIEFLSRAEKFDEKKYEELAKIKKVVAIGEVGLDYSNDTTEEFKALQKEVFLKQIHLAKKINKPIIIHNRNALKDILKILESEFSNWRNGEKLNGVSHFFSGTFEEAQKLFNLGFLVSFTGVITFAPEYEFLIRKLPLDKIMVETDSPYVSPVPHRGKRNEPLNVKFIAQKIADIKGISLKEVENQTTSNAKELFNI